MYDTTKKKCSSEAFGSGCKMHKNKSGFHRYKADVAISLSNLGGNSRSRGTNDQFLLKMSKCRNHYARHLKSERYKYR